ncbi:ThiF family adenylyltransferase [Funiculus sociatus GB2-A5]|uniref:ThiF family adenylyltransferase n=1 Tax=Funiculus sociatus GB2-A5 TaxID=2933946 RepID=A0ABV0JIF5_9CYAN|nr:MULTISPECIES: ThiF family adenylyltransferase [Cyanophyceae]MBD1922487.1 ThiF family adenylyltransferase [Microcoleus sp. FACHB-831]MBD2065736.1 ThiF family adenylyltransferase [Trichocoleus sp. FACHB-6]
MSIFFHEQLHRTPALMAQLRDVPVTVCGVGALGANITENLARSGFGKLVTIDRDRIEERNLSTQPYYRSDVGAYKAKILTNTIYRALGVAVDGRSKELTSANVAQLLAGSGIVIDTFDNSTSRQVVKDYCTNANIPCLHVGLASDYAEVIWNEIYRVPSPANDDVCDYPLARNLVMLAVAVACEVIVTFVATGNKESFTVTLGDFAVKPFDNF